MIKKYFKAIFSFLLLLCILLILLFEIYHYFILGAMECKDINTGIEILMNIIKG